MSNGSNMAASWNGLFASLSIFQPIFTALNYVALGLVVVWVWKVIRGKMGKGDLSGRPGGTGGAMGLSIPRYTLWTLLPAILLASPMLMGSIVLPIADSLVNVVLTLVHQFSQ